MVCGLAVAMHGLYHTCTCLLINLAQEQYTGFHNCRAYNNCTTCSCREKQAMKQTTTATAIFSIMRLMRASDPLLIIIIVGMSAFLTTIVYPCASRVSAARPTIVDLLSNNAELLCKNCFLQKLSSQF